MTAILEILEKLLPLWAVLLLCGFGYLLHLLKRASDGFLEIAHQQSAFLKDRVDVVDKTTVIFTRTIEQQEKEIKRLTEHVSRLGADIQSTRENDARLAVQELRVLAAGIEQVSKAQESLAAAFVSEQRGERRLAPSELVDSPSDVSRGITQAIHARDLSVYPVLVGYLVGAEAVVENLRAFGYAASIYTAEYDKRVENLAENAAIWLGASVPAEHAVAIIEIARRHWPFLRYIHLSVDGHATSDMHYQMYLGGVTSSATDYFNVTAWTDEEFLTLERTMTTEALHAAVRRHYKVPEQDA